MRAKKAPRSWRRLSACEANDRDEDDLVTTTVPTNLEVRRHVRGVGLWPAVPRKPPDRSTSLSRRRLHLFDRQTWRFVSTSRVVSHTNPRTTQSLKGISPRAWGCHSAAPSTPGQRPHPRPTSEEVVYGISVGGKNHISRGVPTGTTTLPGRGARHEPGVERSDHPWHAPRIHQPAKGSARKRGSTGAAWMTPTLRRVRPCPQGTQPSPDPVCGVASRRLSGVGAPHLGADDSNTARNP